MNNEKYIGNKYGMLTVIADHTSYRVKCECECGNTSYHTVYNLNNGQATSCGCQQKEAVRESVMKMNKS